MHQIIASYETHIENIYTENFLLCESKSHCSRSFVWIELQIELQIELRIEIRFIKITWCRSILGSQCDPSPLITRTRVIAVSQPVPQRSILMRTWGSNDRFP
jgi:hypothetical protein